MVQKAKRTFLASVQGIYRFRKVLCMAKISLTKREKEEKYTGLLQKTSAEFSRSALGFHCYPTFIDQLVRNKFSFTILTWQKTIKTCRLTHKHRAVQNNSVGQYKNNTTQEVRHAAQTCRRTRTKHARDKTGRSKHTKEAFADKHEPINITMSV